MQNPILVTGGAGFIGSNFILQWIAQESSPVLNLDKLTYAGNLRNLESIASHPSYRFQQGDIGDRDLVASLLATRASARHRSFRRREPRRPLHPRPRRFRPHQRQRHFQLCWKRRAPTGRLCPKPSANAFRFLHVSTDEVYGSLGPNDPPFSETTPYAPNSPYSASKAASDHLVRAYHHTYGLPTLTTNCSNNYGPYQFPEKLIPLIILNARDGKPLPVYGDGQNVRDWLYVEDHCSAIRTVLAQGRVGETYNIGGCNEKKNLEIVHTICALLDELRPNDPVVPHRDLIAFVKDRPGHDRRYAMDARKIERELHWRPKETFDTGIRKTVDLVLAA